MKKLPPYSKPVSDVLKSRNSDLQHLFYKMYEINRLKKQVLPLLDDAIKSYVEISYDFNQAIVFIVASDAIATRLRFQTPDLLQRFQKNKALCHVKHIHIKIQSYKHNRRMKALPKNNVSLLSEESAETVGLIADSISHPGLKTVMQRIAKRIKKKSTG